MTTLQNSRSRSEFSQLEPREEITSAIAYPRQRGDWRSARARPHVPVLPGFGPVSTRQLTIVDRGSTLGPGDATANLFVLLVHGTLKLSCALPDGRIQILALRYPGELVVPVTTADCWPYTIEAVERSTVFMLDAEAYERWRSREATVDALLAERQERTFARANEHITTLGRKTPIERLASFLLELVQNRPRDRPHTDDLAIPLLRADIADYLGLESETVSRLFSRLKSHRVIELITPRKVRITSLRRLSRLARCEGVLEE